MKKFILGIQYDLNDTADQTKIMDLIDTARENGAANDLSAIAYALLVVTIAKVY